ncbi:MAG TPA: POTRA domain-containing protein [Ferruginibacter sp.]|nr:POTRA domain-containing protein [Ferruginibacter sp.]
MKYLSQITCSIIFHLSFYYCDAQSITVLAGTEKNQIIDSNTIIRISSFHVYGNKKTKKYIILREVQLQEGDTMTISRLYKELAQAKQQVYNTTLFSDVEIHPVFIHPDSTDISITVNEKWYLYPTPQFQLIDRNFNEWIKDYNGDLNRVIYGIKFAHYNLSGRGDRLRIYLLNGYTRNFAFIYNAPYSNPALSEGFSVSASFTQNREVIYKTGFDNKLLKYANEGFVRTSFSSAISYIRRIDFFRRQTFGISYTQINVNDSILTPAYNPSYFNSNTSSKGFPEISYSYKYSNTNNVNYPLKGRAFAIGLIKRGTAFTGGINMFVIDADYNRYLPHGSNWYSSFHVITKLKAPFTQPYINQRALGYGEFFLRGLENYVVDGVIALLGKYSLRKKLLSFKIPVPVKNKYISSIPFAFYAKTYADAGYVYNKKEFNSRLNNRFLYTGGFGLDILSLYDINLRLEYSFNQLGEKGLFLHAKGGF